MVVSRTELVVDQKKEELRTGGQFGKISSYFEKLPDSYKGSRVIKGGVQGDRNENKQRERRRETGNAIKIELC